MLAIFWLINLSVFSVAYATDNDNKNIYNEVLDQTTSRLPGAIGWDVVTDQTGANVFNEQIMNLIGYVIDIFIR